MRLVSFENGRKLLDICRLHTMTLIFDFYSLYTNLLRIQHPLSSPYFVVKVAWLANQVNVFLVLSVLAGSRGSAPHTAMLIALNDPVKEKYNQFVCWLIDKK